MTETLLMGQKSRGPKLIWGRGNWREAKKDGLLCFYTKKGRRMTAPKKIENFLIVGTVN